MTLKQHRLIQWIAITLILSLGAGYYYQTQVKGAQTVISGETPSFQADLKSTLDLQKGIGKPTFTRATTATVTDFEGLLRTAKSGEARFEGARRVENLLPDSDNMGSWSYLTGAVKGGLVADPKGGNNARQVTLSSPTDPFVYKSTTTGLVANRTFRFTGWFKGVGTAIGKSATLYTYGGTGSENATTATITLSSSWQRVSVISTFSPTAVSTTFATRFETVQTGFVDGDEIHIFGAQLEDVTGQANQNPSEYVSTGVLTSAPYHGANVDGVKYFTTYNGNTVAGNVVTEATGAAIPDATLKGYLAEGSRTNLLTYSEQFDNAAWTKSNSTITADATVAPDGKSTADKLVEDTATSTHTITEGFAITSGTTYTASIYLKAGERANVYILLTNTGAWSGGAQSFIVNASTGVISNITGGAVVTSTLVGNGWYRVTMTSLALSTSSSGLAIYLRNEANSYTGDGTSGIYLWGAQLEQASFASSYIPTTTASVARNADVLTYPKTGNVSSNSITVYAEAINKGSASFSRIIDSANWASSGAWVLMTQVNSLQGVFGVSDGVSQYNSFANPTTFNTLFKIAGRYDGSSAVSFLNGVQASVTVAPSIQLYTAGSIVIGSASGQPYGTIRNVKIWKKALTDGQLTAMTSSNDAVAGSAVKGTTLGTDGASFQADLKSTLDLQKGVGKPTFTRATTASVTDFEGLLKTAKSGEARFEGARRVENLLAYSEDFSNAAWIASTANGTASFSPFQTDPYGTSKATLIKHNGVGGVPPSMEIYQIVNKPVGETFCISIFVKGLDGVTYTNSFIRMQNGSSPYNVISSKDITTILNTHTWTRVSISGQNLVVTRAIDIGMVGVNDLINGFLVYAPQNEITTGQANQNPSEYVSTNVLTSAPYHGANVDGVKYFTTENGNTVASNVVTEATGAAIPDATLKGYVAEGSRTNLLTYSEQFDNAAWTKSEITVTADATVAPDGKSTADKLVDNTSTGIHRIAMGSTIASGSTALSVYAKQGGRTTVDMGVYNGTDAWIARSVFNLSNGTVSSTLNGTASIVSVGNGWYRCIVMGTSTVANSAAYFAPNTQAIYTGNGTSGIYLWGAQLEQASFASSYIPTTTASVTRNADVLSYPSAGNVLPSIGTYYAEAMTNDTTNSSANALVFAWTDSSNINSLQFYFNQLRGSSYNTGVFSADIRAGAITTNTKYKSAYRYATDNFGTFLNGTKVGSDTSGSPMLSNLSASFGIGNSMVGAQNLYGTIRNVKIWKKALTDGQLTAMTSANDAVAGSAVKQTTINAPQNDKLTNGLVGFWSFNGLDMSGTTAYDRSGSNNHGTLTGGPTRAIGKVGQGLSFDGVDDFVNLGTSSSSVKTISFWVKPSSTTQSIADLNGTQTVDIASGVVRANSFTSPTIYVDGTATTTLSTTDWHHIAITTDTGINASAFTLGKIASAYFSGKIDEVRIYNRALSASEVSGLYMLGRGPWMCGHDTIKDNDGNAYPTVLIGTQCWMAQNLMTTTYSDGSPITRGPVGATWNGADNGYYAYPPNTGNTAEETLANIQSNKLGFVYQWSAAMKGSTTEGAQGICPAGWHLPTDAEQNTLDQYLTDGGQTCDASRSSTWDCSSAGTKLKTGGTSGWNGALAGYRSTTGGFVSRSVNSYFWSSSLSGGAAWGRVLGTSYSSVYRNAGSKANGFSVRCLKD